MVATSLNDIYKAIGALDANVAGLRRDIDASENRAAAENREADDKRAVVHRRMDELIDEFGAMKIHMASVSTKVDDSNAVTDQVKQWKLMGLGALGVVGLGGTAFGVAIASYFEWIAKLFQK